MTITVFITSVSSSMEIKKHQQRISMVLDSKKVPYKIVDISSDDEGKALMREIAGDQKALPPQIANGSVYCGDYAAFENAVEAEELEKFLKL
ncbi:SH3 domain-binding glutamic acid-rich-like protein 3 isoform X2 [Acanthopagrus latus]|uniref:SH3 domain-binding glutamic acid-rich-like protein 3 isoform X2 n=1 Tax=Acanthopagrus latus TaxID=8177 RepID=UPI00187BE956|nr:SH3 domain-binding glutamic acid-rich-like protein 3 isoform X2 [Acanthopagrus latus]